MTQFVERTTTVVVSEASAGAARPYTAGKPSGPPAAAILAAGIGCAVLGLVTTLAAAIPSFSAALAFVKPVGPLSGKSDLAVAAYVVSWLVLYGVWRGRSINIGRVGTATLILVTIGILGTFPTFFDLFAG
jgi:hypothetical protein